MILNIRNLLTDFKYSEVHQPTVMCNDNRGAVDWSKGCSMSKKLCHVNLRELLVRLHQKLNHIDVQHIPGKQNISGILTKEERDPIHFRSMAFTITTPPLLEHWDHTNGDTLLSDGTLERPRTKHQRGLFSTSNTPSKPALALTTEYSEAPTHASAARGVLTRDCPLYSMNG